MKNWNDTLKCALDNVDIEDENTVTFYLPEGQCVDMTGAIKIATMLSSRVKTINTYSGKEADTRYVRKGKEWQALMYASA
jgi:hypothetical protein